LSDFGKGSAHAYSNAVRAEKFHLIHGVEQQEALAVKQSKAGANGGYSTTRYPKAFSHD